MKRVDVAAAIPRTGREMSFESEEKASGGIVTCKNLRPDPVRRDRLVPTEDFEVIANLPSGSKILGYLRNESNRYGCVAGYGNTIYVVTGTGNPDETPLTTVAGETSGEPYFLIEGKVSEGILMTSEGAYRLLWDDDSFDMFDLTIIPPEASLAIDLEQEITTSVGQCGLSGSYDRSTKELNRSDNANLTADLKEAYKRLRDKSRHADMAIEPILTRYRYIDDNGETVYRSAIKLITSTSENTLIKITGCGISENTREEFDVSATGVRVKLRTPGSNANMAKLIRKIIVEVSPAIPCVDTNIARTENHLIMQDSLLRFYMPGCSTDMSTDEDCLKDKCLKMLRSFDKTAIPMLEIEDPFGENSDQEFILKIPETEADIKNLPENPEEGLTSFQLPHHFTAKTGATNGNTRLWGGIVQLPSKGWGIKDLTVETDFDKGWKSCIIVEKSGGEKAVSTDQGESGAPISITPLLYYPSADATAMEIRIETSDGTTVYRTALKCLPGSGLSIPETFDLTPVRLTYSKEIIYEEVSGAPTPKSIEGICISATRAHPLTAVSARLVADGEIQRITRASASSSAWDYSRSRFYVFGNGGTDVAVTDSGSNIVSSQHLDNRPIINPSHVATGILSKGVTAIAGEKIINVKGSQVEYLYDNPLPDPTAIGYERGDLWISGESGETAVIPECDPNGFYIRDSPTVTSISTIGGNILIIIDISGEMYDSSRKHPATKEIEWSCRIHLPGVIKPPVRGALNGFIRITSIGLRMVASAIRARFSASSDCDLITGTLARLLFSVLLEGSLRSAVFIPVRTAQRSYITLTLKGTVSPDMRLRGAGITYC